MSTLRGEKDLPPDQISDTLEGNDGEKSVVVHLLRFAICEDEPYMAQEIARQLQKYLEGTRHSSSQVSTFENSRALLESGGFDLVFLDIQMERPDGMETARLLRQRGERCLLIFVTVLKERVFEAFQVEAYDYLVKPLDPARFRQTMDRALNALEQRAAKTVLVRRGSCSELVPLADIVYWEVQGHKLFLHKRDGTVLDYYGKLENLAGDRRLFQCHRSYLVNLDWVQGLRDGQALLPGDQAVPVSRLREKELTEALLRRMKEREL